MLDVELLKLLSSTDHVLMFSKLVAPPCSVRSEEESDREYYAEVSQNEGYFVGCPYSKDSSIWGSILGSPYSGKLP